MKRITIGLFVLLGIMISEAVHGQAQFSLGIKAGANFSSINVSDPAATWDSKTGFHGGAFALIKITAFAIQPELIFSQQGSTVKINGQDLDANFSYMNVPVMLKFYLPLGLNLQMGPQFGFLTTAESDYNPITNTPQDGTDLKGFYKNSDVSLGMGIGWDLPMRLSIDARYNLGLTQIEDDPSIEATKNQVFQLSLGYKLFKFGK
jgi:Outer membrane protein beta-barrel domain